jgi:hypothetical protein
VLLDHVVARIRGDVRVDPERADVERPPHRPPQERVADDGDRLDVFEAHTFPTAGHHVNLTAA